MQIDLRHGDCLEVMKTIPDKSIDAIITDPPYGTTACKWDSVIPFEPMWTELKRIIKPDGAIVLFGSEPFSSALRMSNIKQYKYDWYWKKLKPTNHINAKKMPMRYIETISVFYEQQPKFNLNKKQIPIKTTSTTKNTVFGKSIDKYTREVTHDSKFDVLEFKGDYNKLHPTQKPVELLGYLIKTYTLENETVLDFTMGSGTTGVACKNLNRNFIGIELDEKYFQIAKERIENT
jgi:DNA modification methylase